MPPTPLVGGLRSCGRVAGREPRAFFCFTMTEPTGYAGLGLPNAPAARSFMKMLMAVCACGPDALRAASAWPAVAGAHNIASPGLTSTGSRVIGLRFRYVSATRRTSAGPDAAVGVVVGAVVAGLGDFAGSSDGVHPISRIDAKRQMVVRMVGVMQMRSAVLWRLTLVNAAESIRL